MDAAVALAPLADEVTLTSRVRSRLTVALLLVSTLVAFEALAVATILPTAQKELGVIWLYGWAFSAFLLASLVGIVWAGDQCDRTGPARPLLAGIVLFAIGLGIAGFAPSMAVLVAGRTVQGLGAGVVPAVAYVAVGRGYAETARPRVFALMSSAWVVPGLAGPGIAAAVAQTVGWRWVFLGLLPPLVIATTLVLPPLRRLGPPATESSRDPRTRLAFQLVAGGGLFLGGLSAASVVWSPLACVAGLALGGHALSRLLLPGVLTARRGLPSIVLGMSLLNLAFFGADSFVPFLLVTVRDQSTFLAGFILTLSTFAWTAGTWGVERVSGRVARRITMVLGLTLLATGSLAVAAVAAPGVPVWASVPAWSVAALGIGIAYPSFSLAALAATPAGEEGAVGASLKLAEYLGSALGAGIAGAIAAAGVAAGWPGPGVGSAIVLMAGVALAGAVVAQRTRA